MARSSFLMKAIYFILVLIVIAIILNQIVSLNVKTVEEEEAIDLRDKSTDILEILAANERCLGYVEPGSVEGKDIDLTLHRIVDVEKLKTFSIDFSDLEPDCARNFDFGYRVKVETLPINISTHSIEREAGVFGEILRLIDGKKVLFLIDVSGSMEVGSGTYCNQNVKKIECAALFLGGITLDSLTLCNEIGFINLMSDNSEVSVYRYGFYRYISGIRQECQVDRILDLTRLDGIVERENIKNMIKPWLVADDRTPIGRVLNEAFNYAKNNDIEAVVLLTDGVETCSGNPVSESDAYKNEGIVIHTVGFGTDVGGHPTLQQISDNTGGEFFAARTCEELLSQTKDILNVTMPKDIWWFGDTDFSKDEALESSVRVSIPVILRYNISTFIPGRMSIILVNGELEGLIGFVERSCLTEINSLISLALHYPTSLDVIGGKNYLCMEFLNEKRCQRLACEKTIEFDGTKGPGNYKIYTRHENNLLKIIV